MFLPSIFKFVFCRISIVARIRISGKLRYSGPKKR